jgi:hypothetical protein
MNRMFLNELSSVLTNYPDLVVKKKDGKDFLKGILDILDERGTVVRSFSVEIHSTEKYPYRFPKVYEVAGEIPRSPDWHKYDDDSCCFTVEQEEILLCHSGISLIYFIHKVVIPYFANQLYRIKTGHYLNEYPHGLKGVIVFYKDLFKSDDLSFWEKCYTSAFIKGKTGRNDKCYCCSGQKFKNCHLPVENKLKILSEERVLKDIKLIKA